ncbi:hypothetical protein FOPE_02546 [Fonsecaea pedrosoi]|nr:hypothetical protein FOPE_02546 [Fonsecaea pedrosoi]
MTKHASQLAEKYTQGLTSTLGEANLRSLIESHVNRSMDSIDNVNPDALDGLIGAVSERSAIESPAIRNAPNMNDETPIGGWKQNPHSTDLRLQPWYPNARSHIKTTEVVIPQTMNHQSEVSSFPNHLSLLRDHRVLYHTEVLRNVHHPYDSHHAVAEGLVAHFAHTSEPLDQALRLAADLALLVEALYLLRKGARPNFWDTEPRPLGALSSHSATISGPNWKIKSNGDIMGPGETAIFRAAVRNHKHVVELLLQWQADPNLAAESGKTPLHEAASCGHLALVQLLLEHRADPNARDSMWESTPLHDAARAGTTAVALLHRYHADLNAQLKFSRDTPLHLAVREGHEEVVYFLLEKNASPVPTNKSGRRPVHDAARAGNISLVGWLLERDRKGETDPRDNRGWTPMHEAAYGGHNDVVWLLLRRGADGNAALRDGRRAVDLAKERGHGETRKLILASTAGE